MDMKITDASVTEIEKENLTDALETPNSQRRERNRNPRKIKIKVEYKKKL